MSYAGRVLLGLLRSRVGGVAVTTALCAPVLLLLIGFGIDFCYASYINQRLAEAADSAVLTAVSQSTATAVGGYGNLSGLQTYGVNLFNENVKPLAVSGVNFTLNVSSDGAGGVIAAGSYTYTSPTFFAGVIGMRNISMSGNVQSTAKPLTYVNYYILVDASQSMGIGSTATDMQTLYDRVAAKKNGGSGDTGCVFGCHVMGPGQSYTNEDLAHNYSPKVTLRIDSAVAAIQDIISAASSIAGTTKNIKIGLYTIQADPTTTPNSYLGKVTDPPSSNYTALNTAAASMGLGNNTSAGIGDSDFSDELTSFNSTVLTVTQNGDGASAASPLNYVFIVTDGLTDVKGPCTDGHCTKPLDFNLCTSLKQKATVGVIYTTYLPIYTNNDKSQGLDQRYVDLVSPWKDQIEPNLQNCATSTDYYFKANDGPGISAAMVALFLKTQPTSARLTL